MKIAVLARLWVVLASVAIGCGPSDMAPPDNPVPFVEATDPELVTRSSMGADVDVLGRGFMDNSIARWNGDERSTSYVSSTVVKVILTGQDLEATSGELDVVNPGPGGGTSGALTLVVGNPLPQITSLSPTSVPAVVASELVLQVVGADFVAGPPSSVVRWNGVPLGTVVVSPTELTAVVPDYLMQAGGSIAVTVHNPGPGGGESNPALFGVENPLPVVTGTDPGGVPSGVDFPIAVLGTDFTYGASVWIDDTPLTPDAVSSSRLDVVVPGTLAVGGTTLALRVENRPPGGGFSNEVALDVWTTPPRIDYLSPALVFTGSPDFTLTIVGADFDPLATVTANGVPRSVTFVSSTRLQVGILAADVATGGGLEIRVTNPGEGSVALTVLAVVEPGESNRIVAEKWGGRDILVANLDGSDATTWRPGGGAARVDASPVALNAVFHGSDRIWEIDAVTGSSRRLTTGTPASTLRSESWPRYSSDGAWVYFTGEARVWRVRTDGSAAEVVADEPGAYPAPSNVSDRVVYAPGDGGGPLRIYDVASASSTPLGVTGLTSRWSPDDQWIIYLADGWDLRAVRPDGSDDFAVVTSVDVGFGFDFTSDGNAIVSTTQSGEGILIAFPSGEVQTLPALGQIASIAFFGR